jgi:hypothetical protein
MSRSQPDSRSINTSAVYTLQSTRDNLGKEVQDKTKAKTFLMQLKQSNPMSILV